MEYYLKVLKLNLKKKCKWIAKMLKFINPIYLCVFPKFLNDQHNQNLAEKNVYYMLSDV